VVALGVLLAPVCLWAGGRRHHLIACCCASLVLYQTALSCAGFHMPLYASNIYLACLVVIAVAVPCVWEQLKSIHGKAEIGKAESRNWQ
jgi:hypothetical protein